MTRYEAWYSLPGGVMFPGFADAACYNAPEQDKRDFFKGSDSDYIEQGIARDRLWAAYCRDCPVRVQCFEWAMKWEDYGIWAGTTERDRKEARKKLQLAREGYRRVLRGDIPFRPHRCVRCPRLVSRSSKSGLCIRCIGGAKKGMKYVKRKRQG